MRLSSSLAVLALTLMVPACTVGTSVVGGPLDASPADVPADSMDAKIDVAPDDVPDAPDVLSVDATDIAPDVRPFCRTNADCAGNELGLGVCDTTSGRCVACTATPDTCAADQHCEPVAQRCVPGCHADEGCATASSDAGTAADAGAPANHCNVGTHTCVACVTDAHCPSGQLCMGNVCVVGCSPDHACPAGQMCCAGGCVDTQRNTSHCGACGAPCNLARAVASCVGGACAVASCADGAGDCDMIAANGCETDTRTTLAHCGACGMRCAERPNASVTCVAGACQYACNAGLGDCDMDPMNGCETVTQSNPSHCGGCGMACAVRAHSTVTCVTGACQYACETGFADCDMNPANGCEVDLRVTTAHCGMCGRACAIPHATAACMGGTCVVGACDAGFADCDMSPDNGCEVDTRTSTSHCGMCGRACSLPNATESCVAGACAIAACNAGFGDCDMTAANGCEAALDTNARCGACGNVCASGTRCSMGSCVSVCPTGSAFCAATSTCAVLATDPANCGTCGVVCPARASATATCVGGACGFTCDTGFGDCDTLAANGCEVDTRSTVAHCGGCGRACAARPNATPSCAAGVCQYACLPGFADCDGNTANGCEVNTAVNTDHCGMCGRACPDGATCVASSCSCPVGTTACGGRCVNLGADPANCGVCGRACGVGQVCVAGSCTSACAAGSTFCSGRCVLLGSDVDNCGSCGHACTAEQSCSGGVCTSVVGTSAIGCADGQREGFGDMTRFPNIAACSGGWTVPGIFPAPSRTMVSSCATSGDDSTTNTTGTGCSSADLCAPGWHLCHGGEIQARATGGCSATTFPDTTFYAAAVSGTGCGVCALLSGSVTSGCNSSNCITNCLEAPTLNNDFFGCGTTGAAIAAAGCDGLDRFSNNNCGNLPAPWTCSGSIAESLTVTKTGVAAGGVLCCR